MSQSDPIGHAMQAAVERGVFPGAVLLVRVRGHVAYHHAFGRASLIPVPQQARPDTIYDLASLTKPLATTTAVLCLVQDGQLGPDRPLQSLLDELTGSPIGDVTVSHLLTHSAGLPAWRPLYERIAEEDRRRPGLLGSEAAKQMVLDCIKQEPLLSPAGTRSLYSDVGFILLGMVVERVAGRSLAIFCRERIFAPMQAAPLFFVGTGGVVLGSGEPAPDLRLVAPTEEDPWRGRVLRAEVHDENAYALGGVAGHAGLFGTGSAVLAVAGHWLGSYLGRERLLAPDLVRRFVTRQGRMEGSSWALGWDTPSAPSSSGSRFSPHSFGHLGYTGTSLWIDPTCELEVVLLSNRVHPTKQNTAIQQFRPLIHDVIYEEFVD